MLASPSTRKHAASGGFALVAAREARLATTARAVLRARRSSMPKPASASPLEIQTESPPARAIDACDSSPTRISADWLRKSQAKARRASSCTTRASLRRPRSRARASEIISTTQLGAPGATTFTATKAPICGRVEQHRHRHGRVGEELRQPRVQRGTMPLRTITASATSRLPAMRAHGTSDRSSPAPRQSATQLGAM